MLLNIPQCTRQLTAQKDLITMSRVLELKNSALDIFKLIISNVLTNILRKSFLAVLGNELEAFTLRCFYF